MADLTPVLGLAGLILVKEVGVPIPVPGDLVVIGAGVAASQGQTNAAVALAALILASIAGGTVQFALLRSVARRGVLRLLGRLGLADRIESQTARLRDTGASRIAVARMTPGVRVVTIAAGAIAGVRPTAFVVGLIAGNAVFIAAHFALGFVLGEPVVRLAGGALAPLAVSGVVVAVVGLAGWLLIRARRTGRPATTRPATEPAGGSTLAAWADACCPACLVLGGAAETSGA